MTHDEFEAIAASRAVGAATAEEERALDVHLTECEQCRRAADDYDHVAGLLALSVPPIPPPEDARAAVMQAVRTSRRPEAVARSGQRFERRTWLLPAAAIVAGIGLLLSLAQLTALRRERSLLSAENDALRKTVAALTSARDQLQAETRSLLDANRSMAASLASRETNAIQLIGQVAAPAASARVFVDRSKSRALVFLKGLPLTSEDKQYQLWVIRTDRPEPVGIGVFDVKAGEDSVVVLENLPAFDNLKALAVTLEPRGGRPAPTGQMYLVSS